jgi:predicted ferric reductase
MELWWYVDRSAGVTSYLLLALATGFGIATSTRLFARQASHAWTLAVHRFLGALSVVFLGVHIIGVLANPHAGIGLRGSFVPFATHWHPAAMAWGIVAGWLVLAVELTSLVRNRLPPKLWRWIHLTSYAVFFGSTVHLLAAGTDGGSRWLPLGAFAATGIVCFVSIAAALERTTVPQP